MKEIEDEKEKRNRTDYKRALKPRKPRPRQLMLDENKLKDTSSALLAQMNYEEELKRKCSLGKTRSLSPLLRTTQILDLDQCKEEEVLSEPQNVS